MNIFRLFAVFLTFVVPIFGEMPETVDGFVYYEVSFEPGGLRNMNVAALLLNKDGSFSGLFQITVPTVSTSTRLPIASIVDGTYSYQKTSSTSAELTLNPRPGNWYGGSLRKLSSNSGTTGSIVNITAGSPQLFYLVPANKPPTFTNASQLSFLRAGGTATSGLVVQSYTPVLVRAIGPGLSAFGISDFLQTPTLTIFDGRSRIVATNSDWTSESSIAMSRTATFVGAFPLREGSKDAGIIIVPGGTNTVQVSSANPSDSGQVLVEVYALPFPLP